jgi:hypothetical protein
MLRMTAQTESTKYSGMNFQEDALGGLARRKLAPDPLHDCRGSVGNVEAQWISEMEEIY